MSSAVALVVGGVGVLVGLFGSVVPVVPGLLLVLVATLGTLLAAGEAGAVVVAVLLVLFAVGQLASIALPARRGRAVGVPTRSLVTGLAFALVGAIAIPVVGILVGGAFGVYVAERQRLDEHPAAVASTRAVVEGYGIGVLVELSAGILMAVVWLLALFVV